MCERPWASPAAIAELTLHQLAIVWSPKPPAPAIDWGAEIRAIRDEAEAWGGS